MKFWWPFLFLLDRRVADFFCRHIETRLVDVLARVNHSVVFGNFFFLLYILLATVTELSLDWPVD